MEFGPTVEVGVPPMPAFWMGPLETGDGFRECHIAFHASDRDAVHAFMNAAVKIGTEVLSAARLLAD